MPQVRLGKSVPYSAFSGYISLCTVYLIIVGISSRGLLSSPMYMYMYILHFELSNDHEALPDCVQVHVHVYVNMNSCLPVVVSSHTYSNVTCLNPQ